MHGIGIHRQIERLCISAIPRDGEGFRGGEVARGPVDICPCEACRSGIAAAEDVDGYIEDFCSGNLNLEGLARL